MPILHLARVLPQAKVESTKDAFRGFQQPTSNTIYTPNQFFDVCLPTYSRGVVRLVGFMIRKTLGWCDADGHPQETQIRFTYRDLEKKAGIGHSMIRQAIDEAIRGHFIIPSGEKFRSNETLAYELCWDESGQYTTDPSRFQGFFAQEGNRTYIPNDFFDVVIPQETLATIRVVGTIIRRTIGFQNRYGHRRQRVQMSYETIQRQSGVRSPATLSEALQTALAKNYALCLERGVFDPVAGRESRASVYCIRWADLSQNQEATPKSEAGFSHSENRSGITPIPEAARHSEKRSDIEITPENKTSETTQPGQADAVVDRTEASLLLRQAGFSESVARELTERHTPETVRNQVNWLEKRHPTRNRLGLLRRAIEENWPAPEEFRSNETLEIPGAIFAAHFYAGYHDNPDAPISEPSPSDIETGKQFIDRILMLWPESAQAPVWGREFGQHVRSKHRDRSPMFITLSSALRSFGDEFYARLKTRHEQERETNLQSGKQQHRERFWTDYLEYLQTKARQIEKDQPEAFAQFLQGRQTERRHLESDRFVLKREETLHRFDSQERYRLDFQKHFSSEVFDFWDWDREANPQLLIHSSSSPCRSSQ